ncbi:MAG TPA: hypothetical protein VEU29_03945 [Actinomycetota bacterium]|nr:hypothetical protein [Actinomycetota bacterium]
MTLLPRKTALVVASLALVAVAGVGRSTFASFNGAVRNGGNTFAFTSLYAPGNLTATPAGLGVDLAWTAGQNGNGYRVLSAPAPNPLVNDCTGVSYFTLATTVSTSYHHAVSIPPGMWRCYTVQTSYHAWTSVEGNPVAGARMGFVASVASFGNTGNPRIDDNDTITITFNQPVATATGPQAGNSICWQSDRIVLGSTQTGNCSATDLSPRLGFLTGGTIDRNFRLAATWAWSNDNRTLTITVGARLAGSGNYAHTGTWTFVPTPNASLLQSATGAIHVCDTNDGGGNCTPTVAGL